MTEQVKKRTGNTVAVRLRMRDADGTIHVLTIGRGPAEDDKGGFDELVEAIKELKRATEASR